MSFAAACTAPVQPMIPPYFQPDQLLSSSLRLRQEVALRGDLIEVCRILTNVDPQPVTLPHLLATGESYGQFGSYYFDARGESLRYDIHRPWPVPPLPPDGSSEPPTTTLAPGGSFRNCERLEPPERLTSFSVVSTYGPYGSTARIAGRTINHGEILSNTCLVSQRTGVRCSVSTAD